jgi:hypothetical protein
MPRDPCRYSTIEQSSQGQPHGFSSHRFAVASKMLAPYRESYPLAAHFGPAEPHRSHGLARHCTIGTGYAGNGHRQLRSGTL